jgi:hypothetical protein
MGRPAQHLGRVISTAVHTLERHPDFLRLLIVFAAQPPAAARDEIQTMVRGVREQALTRLREQLSIAFRDDPRSPTNIQLAQFALAAFDGAFVASQADPAITLVRLLEPLAPALVAARRVLLSRPR